MNTSKIIRAVVGSGKYTKTAAITKEDSGRILKIEGIELPETYEIDFSNDRKEGTSVTMIGNADGVLIPTQFIKTGKDVYAFLYWVGADYGKTVYTFHIPNHVRPDRTNEEPEPEQQSVIDQAIVALNNAVTQTAQDVVDADASAQSAAESAENAAQSASQAAESAQNAHTYALSANVASGTASNFAEVSQAYASQAQTSAQTASEKAAQASSAESAAASAAQTATAKAIEAAQIVEGVEGYAESAAQSASSAATSATTASTKASESSASASTASTKATEATTAATTATTAKDDAVSAKNAAETAQAAAETAQEAAEDAAERVGASAAQIAQNTADISSVKEDLNAVIDASSELANFDSVPTVNATYYTGKVRNWGTITNRVIPTKTLVYPFDVVLTASDDYSFGVHDLHQAYEFSGDQSASGTQLTSGWVTTFTVPKNTNFLIVLAKGSNHNLAITPEDFHVAMTADTTQPDLTKLALSVNELTAELDEVNDSIDDKIADIIDSSSLFTDFASAPTYNATYYSGGVKEWGTATKRVLNTTTLSYPVPVKLSCADGYVITVDELESPQTFTSNKSVRSLRTSGDVTEFVCSANSNILVVIKSSDVIDPSIWADVMSIEMYPHDLTELSEAVDSLVQPSTYHVDGAMIDVTHQGFRAERIFNPPTNPLNTSSALQATAYYGGVIFQMYADGTVVLIDFASGTIINSLALAADHSGSASFSSEFYDTTDEFPLFYVSDHETRVTRAYRVTRTGFTLVKTYEIPASDGGYAQATCVDKSDNTLWSIGSSVNSTVTGEYFYVSHWNLSDATENDGIYTPVLISKHQLPWKKYMQYIQYLNGQLFVGFGVRDTSQSAEITDTVMWVIDCGTGTIKSIMSEFPQHIIDSEIEGCDFIPDGNKYKMLVSTRAHFSYHVLTF